MHDLREAFESRTYDFVDFGAGTGQSMLHYERMSGCTGAGVELREAKVSEAQEQGRAVFLGSIFDLPDTVRARFVTADNVLEHLPTFDDVERAIAMAKEIASDFFLVRHPSFDDEDHLATLGLRPYWANWRGHPSHVHLTDFAAMAARVGVTSWTVQPVCRIHSTADPALIPLTAPIDQMGYDPERHDPKGEEIVFDRAVYQAYDIIFHFSPEPRVRLQYKLPPETVLTKPRLILAPAPHGGAAAGSVTTAAWSRDRAGAASSTGRSSLRRRIKRAIPASLLERATSRTASA